MPASKLPTEREDLIVETYRRTGSINQTVREVGHSKETVRRVLDEREEPRISSAGAAPSAPSVEDALRDSEERDRRRQEAAELRKMLASESRLQRYETILRDVLTAYSPTELVVEGPRHEDDAPVHEYTVILSDWHVGQATRIEETGGIYEQDVSTTRQQVFKLWNALASIHDVESRGRKITKLNILAIGDFVDGDDMRPSQHRKVEDVITVQTIQAFDLLVWFIRQALQRFEFVDVDFVGGNHDRLSRKAGDAGLGELSYIDTVAWLLGAFTQRTLESDIEEGRLSVRNWETFFGYKKVSNMKVVFEHGSSFKWAANSYGGVPWYGVANLGPKYESMLGGADIVAMGHGHRAAVIPNGRNWVITNGALPATSTYAQSAMKSVMRPLQWLLSTHADHGLTSWMPLYADVPGQLLPGMVWEDPVGYADQASS